MKKLRRLFSIPVVGPVAMKYFNYRADKEAMAISSHFFDHFRIFLASTPELRETVFKIRHAVYCEEKRYLELRDDHLERDSFDDHCAHCLIQHKNGKYAGTVRSVFSNSLKQKLPIEVHCEESLRNASVKPQELERDTIFEVSRITITEEFRKRTHGDSHYSKMERRCFPFIPLVLYLAAASMGLDSGCTNCFVITPPWIVSNVKFAGINWQPNGEPIDYHGLRAPYFINESIFDEGLSLASRTLFNHIERALYGKEPRFLCE